MLRPLIGEPIPNAVENGLFLCLVFLRRDVATRRQFVLLLNTRFRRLTGGSRRGCLSPLNRRRGLYLFGLRSAFHVTEQIGGQYAADEGAGAIRMSRDVDSQSGTTKSLD